MINKFLTALGITGPDQDNVDIEYLQDVHWELWEKITSRIITD